ncbi:putative branched-chain-amino-acid aminotransferase TOXF [Colletotrichum liriopes]|uniref:Branched-chain-amino-acid aminotransferase TOXF n=1 Tax=Colletotrichum liriopes TaxID=708192 RepID=A0AA37LYZ7_9PEZI|nr:putative branched-chain-amino-acid aminotransferase TOXF [Colletotrichum liriopes]
MIQPKADYKWDAYDSKKNDVAGHVECTFNVEEESWTAPRFVRSPFLSIHGLAPGLNYGNLVTKSSSSRRSPDGEILIFRPEANAARLKRSATFLSIPDVPEKLFLESVQLAVRFNAEYVCPHNVNGSLYIRPLLFGSGVQIGLEPLTTSRSAFTFNHISLSMATVIDDFDRAATRGSGAVKVGGNYAPVMRWTCFAKQSGYNVLLHLDSQTQTEIDEFSTSGFIGIRHDEHQTTLVVADSKAAIDSITSDSAAKLARSLGWTVEKRVVRFNELATFSEVLAAGTAAGLVPVSYIRRESTNQTFDFLPDGPHYQKLWTKLQGIQNGTLEDEFKWCTKLVE